LGVLLQQWRAAAGLSQEELAAKAGLSQRGISDLERGERRLPRPDTVRRLAEALDLDQAARAALLAAAAPAASAADGVSTHAVLGLPAQPGPLIGRAADIGRVREHLLCADVRLLTLVGAAGAGKTRLALEVASHTAAEFEHGIRFVDLSPVRDPDLVPSAIAASLQVREDRAGPLIETLKRHLADRCALLVLDNFEQVLPAAPCLADLLRGCPKLKLLVTSRSALHLQWEHELVVQPLAVPDLGDLPGPAGLGQIASVALLVQRAQQRDPEFRLTDDNAPAIAEVCVRLDGLPLAIELAAARMRVLPPRALLSRLGRGLAVLEGGRRDQPLRQRTLRAALDWSYELLSPADQALFRRLGVFVGGFALEAVAEVCDPDGALGIDPLGGIESLVEKSLVRPIRAAGSQETRFGLLETIREYALEQLDTHGERPLVRARHAQYYLSGADVAFGRISSAHQAAWLRNLELEHDNLRAALAWCRETRQPELGLRAAGLLAWFWQVRGHISEGRARLTELLALADDVPPALRAEGLRIAGNLALSQFDDRAARALVEESLALRRRLGDPAGLLGPLSSLGYTAIQRGDDDTAQACFDEALAIQRRLDDRVGIAESLNSLANLAHGRGDLATARALYEESQAFNRDIGYRSDVVEHNLGVVAQEQGDLDAARRYFEASVLARRALDDTPGLALSLAKLGEVLAAQGDLAGAHQALAESAVVQRDLGGRPQLAFVLERAAIVAAMHALPERALRLAGASSALRETLGVPLNSAAQASLDAQLAPARQALGPGLADLAWQHGRAMSAEDAIGLVLEPTPPPEATHAGRGPGAAQLTPREREVAALVARGLTNRQIAATLVISERTADVHVSNILNKLTLNSRAQLAAWVVREGFL
jgi:predicted ATPase/DNA-binding CsgD family transcriptional regulator/DNA-binding XRE family transcriptional regulator